MFDFLPDWWQANVQTIFDSIPSSTWICVAVGLFLPLLCQLDGPDKSKSKHKRGDDDDD